MTGTVVESRPSGRGLGAVLVVAAVALGGLAVATGSPHPVVLAALPLALAVAVRRSVEPPVRFELTEHGLSFDLPEFAIVRFDEVRGLTAPGWAEGDEFAMQIYHPDGVIRIPPRLTVSSRDLYRFLFSRLPSPEAPPADIPSQLRSFLAEQTDRFGAEKVFVFLARPFPAAPGHRRRVACWLAVAAAGLVWVIAGAALGKGSEPWIVSGLVAGLLGLICAIGFRYRGGSGRVRNWQDSCLVVSPGGIALLQGTLCGRMRWDELRAIEFPANARYRLIPSGEVKYGIRLLVDGAYLVVADYYDRPLTQIHDRLRAYWGGRDAN
ncbi:MAG: hypothetical protein JWO38_5438 [Gemmataceae bacterium]|nr:hypothetical protein [Gemmataceae bacterium]